MPNALYFKDFVNQLAERANIKINGDKPSDILVHDESFYERVFRNGSLGFGESYMDGLWDCEQLDELMARIITADFSDLVRFNVKKMLYLAKARVLNRQSVNRSKVVAKRHYDIGNDLFEKMLDSRMMYSCAYWKDANDLEEAQEAKLDLICKKLKLKAGERVLDVGCGWGGFAKYAAERYGVYVVGITISKEQEIRAKERCENLSVEIRLQDYRELTGEFDKVVSIGMFEHVGYKNYESYMNVVHRVLRKEGLFLLHCIGSNQSVTVSDAWFNKYVFPNGMMPSISQIGKAVENKFNLEDWHNMGLHYDPTLMEWLKRFKESWASLQNSYDHSFYRMWIYYLATSAASFRVKSNNLWQIVFSKIGNRICYESVR